MMKLTGLELQLRILQLIFQEPEIKYQVVRAELFKDSKDATTNVCDTYFNDYLSSFLDEVEVTSADAAVGNGNTTEDPTADIPGARDDISSGKVMIKILNVEIK